MNLIDQFGEASEKLKIKLISQVHFRLLNFCRRPLPGRRYRVRRSNGALEMWQLLKIDESTGLLIMGRVAF
ncbi:MAG: hypothetical protein K2W95_34265 [Candidatus Obscuribacterales bacterium]|nr:hypothetical protein [Candidatus Obscuribacterales bacterium]